MISPTRSKDIDVYKSSKFGYDSEENKAKMNGGPCVKAVVGQGQMFKRKAKESFKVKVSGQSSSVFSGAAPNKRMQPNAQAGRLSRFE